ncbi:hypothetical protein HYX13_00440 [Candidatus Woesearchaeota archaeon]|nr:hypothetical protein [Candidatus Woesearchaeota archaeon]
MKLKVVGGLLVAITVLNLILFTFGKISPRTFWIIIILMALVAWKGLPKLNIHNL